MGAAAPQQQGQGVAPPPSQGGFSPFSGGFNRGLINSTNTTTQADMMGGNRGGGNFGQAMQNMGMGGFGGNMGMGMGMNPQQAMLRGIGQGLPPGQQQATPQMQRMANEMATGSYAGTGRMATPNDPNVIAAQGGFAGMQQQMMGRPQQQMMGRPQQQMMPQQSGLQALYGQMMGQYNRPMMRQQQMPQYQSQARAYRPDMTQASQNLNRTATTQEEARQKTAADALSAQEEAEFQTYLRDQFIRSRNSGGDGGGGS
jgi:hypothetical protein